jgi:Zn-finger nucleic acid-binding protein
MMCPKCSKDMKIKTIMDVELDICPSCKGVWLDEGELGKLAGIDPTANSFAHALYNIYSELKREEDEAEEE